MSDSTQSGAFSFVFIPFDQDEVQAGNIAAEQTASNSNGNNVNVTLTGSTSDFALDHDRIDNSNRGDYHVRVGDATDDDVTGVYLTGVAQNGVDHGYGDGEQFGTVGISYRSDHSVFLPTAEAPGGGEYNTNVSAAYFEYDDYLAGWARISGGEIGTLLGGDSMGDAALERNDDYTYTLTIGEGAAENGVLMVVGGVNGSAYAQARPTEDGSGFVIGTHDSSENGYTYSNENFGFVYLEKGDENLTFGRVLSDGSSQVSNGDYEIAKIGVGEYRLTIAGYTPEDGALVLSAEGLDGLNADNIVSYEPDGDGWIIQTRDIPTMELEDAGESVIPDFLDEIHDEVDSAYVGASIEELISAYEDAAGGHVMVAAHRAGYWDGGERVLPENSLSAIENAIDNGVDILEVDLRETADGQFVLMHDGSIDRTTTGSGSVSSKTLAELRELNLIIEGTGEVTDEKIPTLDELFAAIDDRVLVNLDKVAVSQFAEVSALAAAAGVADQIILKASIGSLADIAAVKAALNASAEGVHFMPIFPVGTSAEVIKATFETLRPDAAEINVSPGSNGVVDDPGAFFSDEIRALFEEYDVRYFLNTLFGGQGNGDGSMSGGIGDFTALERPDLVYGYWADQGVTIIQTDESKIAANYLNKAGYRIAYGEAAVIGTSGDDVMEGDQEVNELIGLAGDDELYGAGGDDRLFGGEDDDQLYGGDDDDLLDGGDGDDRIFGEAGADRLHGGAGDDLLDAGDGDDVLFGDSGDDVLNGGAGVDLVDYSAEETAIQVDLEAGYAYGAGIDFDTLLSVENIVAGAGDDLLIGDAGANELRGGAGDDVLAGGAGDDLLDGGDGVDTVDYSDATDKMIIDLTAGTATRKSETDQLVDIENAIGGANSDTMIGDSADNAFTGGAGNDTLKGGGGDDALTGGEGADRLYGESGDDVLDGGAGDDRLFGGDGADELHGGEGDDYLYGDAGDNILHGGAGDDVIRANEGADQIDAGSGDDRVTSGSGDDVIDAGAGDDDVQVGAGDDIVHGGAGSDDVSTGSGDDQLFGDDGDDVLNSGSGADQLEGGAGDDRLTAGSGDDVLIGGAGDDLLIGGSGADKFVVGGGSGADQIVDFYAAWGDQLVISGGRFSDVEAALEAAEQVGRDVIFDLGEGDSVTLLNTDLDDLGDALLLA